MSISFLDLPVPLPSISVLAVATDTPIVIPASVTPSSPIARPCVSESKPDCVTVPIFVFFCSAVEPNTWINPD